MTFKQQRIVELYKMNVPIHMIQQDKFVQCSLHYVIKVVYAATCVKG